MRLPNWIARWFKKPEPQQARIPHADEEGDRQRRILLLTLSRSELSGIIAELKRKKKKYSHVEATLEALTNEQLALENKTYQGKMSDFEALGGRLESKPAYPYLRQVL